jgi:hypothetical protein
LLRALAKWEALLWEEHRQVPRLLRSKPQVSALSLSPCSRLLLSSGLLTPLSPRPCPLLPVVTSGTAQSRDWTSRKVHSASWPFLPRSQHHSSEVLCKTKAQPLMTCGPVSFYSWPPWKLNIQPRTSGAA